MKIGFSGVFFFAIFGWWLLGFYFPLQQTVPDVDDEGYSRQPETLFDDILIEMNSVKWGGGGGGFFCLLIFLMIILKSI